MSAGLTGFSVKYPLWRTAAARRNTPHCALGRFVDDPNWCSVHFKGLLPGLGARRVIYATLRTVKDSVHEFTVRIRLPCRGSRFRLAPVACRTGSALP